MATLISRQRFIPGGLRFVQAEIKWASTPNASFDTIVRSLIAARQANPAAMQKYGWSTDYATVANEVDAFNARICEQMGWTDYISGGTGASAAAPFPPARSSLSLQSERLVAGVKTLAEMLGPEGPVGRPVAEARAAVCAACPFNLKGDWTRFFTIPASNAIRAMLGMLGEAKLETSYDPQLMLCDACGCPCKTKVWARLPHILAHMPPESKQALHPSCWMRKEGGF